MNGMSASGRYAVPRRALTDGLTKSARAASPFFPPVVALYVVKLAGDRPDIVGRSLSQWESTELARQLGHDGVVEAMSPQTVQRLLAHHTLQPWRHHLWLSPPVPRDAALAAQVTEMAPLYTRPLGVWEMVGCVDEKNQSATPQAHRAPPGGPAGGARAGGAYVCPPRGLEPVRRL